MIEIRDLRFAFPRGGFALAIDAFDVAAGEHVAVVGPSGSGKTTLLNLIAGILLPDAGSVLVDTKRVDRMAQAARRGFRLTRLGMIFQSFELVDYLSVADNILLPCRIGSHLPLTRDMRARAADLAEAAGLGDKLGRRPAELSQGEQQRAAICRALLARPALLLADEATGNLDPINKGAMLDLLFEQARLVGAAILAVTHDHDLLPRFDRTVDFAAFRSA